MSNPEKITIDNYGSVDVNTKSSVAICRLCGFPYEKHRMRKYKNNYYCKPNGCYLDIVGLRKVGDRIQDKPVPDIPYNGKLDSNVYLLTPNIDYLLAPNGDLLFVDEG